MELQLKYKEKDYAKTREMVISAYDDMGRHFKEKLENLVVCVHKDRKEFVEKINE